jgi:hypothetical protein
MGESADTQHRDRIAAIFRRIEVAAAQIATTTMECIEEGDYDGSLSCLLAGLLEGFTAIADQFEEVARKLARDIEDIRRRQEEEDGSER